MLGFFPNVIPSELLVEMLKRVVTEEANENSRLAGCEVERILKNLINEQILRDLLYWVWNVYISQFYPVNQKEALKYWKKN